MRSFGNMDQKRGCLDIAVFYLEKKFRSFVNKISDAFRCIMSLKRPSVSIILVLKIRGRNIDKALAMMMGF